MITCSSLSYHLHIPFHYPCHYHSYNYHPWPMNIAPSITTNFLIPFLVLQGMCRYESMPDETSQALPNGKIPLSSGRLYLFMNYLSFLFSKAKFCRVQCSNLGVSQSFVSLKNEEVGMYTCSTVDPQIKGYRPPCPKISWFSIFRPRPLRRGQPGPKEMYV